MTAKSFLSAPLPRSSAGVAAAKLAAGPLGLVQQLLARLWVFHWQGWPYLMMLMLCWC